MKKPSNKTRLIEDGFQSLKRAAITSTTSPFQTEELRKAFYAGALVSFNLVVKALVERNHNEVFDALHAEFHSFGEKLHRETAGAEDESS
jgi:hypothetical protein